MDYFNWSATHLLSSDVVYKYGFYFLPAKEAEEKGFKFEVSYSRLQGSEKRTSM